MLLLRTQASLMKWETIPEEAFLIAAEALAKMTTAEDHAAGRWVGVETPGRGRCGWAGVKMI